jgi:hypothetical protein
MQRDEAEDVFERCQIAVAADNHNIGGAWSLAEKRRSVRKTGAMSGPRSGERAPDFTLPTVDGTPWTLSEHLGDGDVVLVFLRGFF